MMLAQECRASCSRICLTLAAPQSSAGQLSHGQQRFPHVGAAVRDTFGHKGLDGLNRHCYQGDLLGYLSPEQSAHFLRLGLVEKVDASAQDTTRTRLSTAEAGRFSTTPASRSETFRPT
jgi:hypothetical protein